jgi:hypothetical protein
VRRLRLPFQLYGCFLWRPFCLTLCRFCSLATQPSAALSHLQPGRDLPHILGHAPYSRGLLDRSHHQRRGIAQARGHHGQRSRVPEARGARELWGSYRVAPVADTVIETHPKVRRSLHSSKGAQMPTTNEHLRSGGLTRRYLIHVPANLLPQPSVVIHLHGGEGIRNINDLSDPSAGEYGRCALR